MKMVFQMYRSPSEVLDLSIVVPVFNESEGILDFLDHLRFVLEKMSVSYEVLLIDDGSTDSTIEKLLTMNWLQCKVLQLGRNRGHQAALMVGIRAAAGMKIITMDSDGQHPPEVIVELVETQQRDNVDVVYAIRSRSQDLPFLKRFFSRLFYVFVKLTTNTPVKPGQADFRLITQSVRSELIENAGPTVLRIEIPQLRFPSRQISYVENKRIAGKTKFTRKKMLEIAFGFLYDTSSLPLRAASVLAFLLSGVTCLWIIVVIATFISSQTITGWASVMTAVLVLGSAITALLAIQGQYLARVYELARGLQTVRIRNEFTLGDNQGRSEK